MQALTPDMIMVLVILAGTVVVFITEVVRIDIAALSILVVLGLTGLLEAEDLFAGFSSTAVVAIIAIMILGAGLDRAGIMREIANFLVDIGGETERRIRATTSGAVATISSFMQNIGAAALFLPVVERMADQTKTPLSQLLMPMGFIALVGGTLTLVGSTPLILLNDLLATTAANLDIEIEPFGLFAPTPVGLALVASGILLFLLFGRQLLPEVSEDDVPSSPLPDIADHYGLDREVHPYDVSQNSPLAGERIGTTESEYPEILLVAMHEADGLVVAPPRDYIVEPGSTIGLVGYPEDIQQFVDDFNLSEAGGSPFAVMEDEERGGLAEVLVRPESDAVGKTVRDIHMRGIYEVTLLGVYRDDELLFEELREVELQAGDILIVFAAWDKLDHLIEETSLATMSDYPSTPPRPGKKWWAIGAFAIAIGLVLFTDLPLPLSLMTGAVLILLSGVLTPNEAYRSISWQTVFLLGGLIPLGTAVEQTGTAAWIAGGVVQASGDLPLWGIQLVLAVMTTAFTLTISNAGATVLLVPLAANIALGVGADPRQFALIVGLAASNSFILPTHQVNALVMSPGGYEVKDYLRAGGAMTLVFLVVLITAVNVLY